MHTIIQNITYYDTWLCGMIQLLANSRETRSNALYHTAQKQILFSAPKIGTGQARFLPKQCYHLGLASV